MTFWSDPAWWGLVLTVAVEVAVALAWLGSRSVSEGGAHRWELAGSILAVNLMSHPVAFMTHASGAAWVTVELGVIAFEAAALRVLLGLGARRALGLSTVLNAVTAALGAGIALS